MKKGMRFLGFMMMVAMTFSAFSQTCTCESNFEWTKKTFEENDAGFQYIIDKKGEAAYQIHNQLILEKIRSAKTSAECTKIVYEWLTFFRSSHIGIERLKEEDSEISGNPEPTTQEGVYETWEVDIPQFEKYLNEKKEVDYEGIWDAEVYKIGIQKVGENYIGFIIETDVDTWEPKQVKLKIEKVDGKMKSTFYMRDHTPNESGEPEMWGDNYLIIRPQFMERLTPTLPKDPFVENYIRFMFDEDYFFIEELNKNTLYLSIPFFEPEDKPVIDSLIAANKEKILKTENLIIDLRYNGGGSDESFQELLPILYTNPIKNVMPEFLSTPLNNQRFLEFSTDPDFSEEDQKWAKESYEKVQSRLGEFVNVFGEDITVDQFDTIYEFPKNIGIIINEECASTTEQFLLAAKQSKKVKLFGVTTAGALDISNMYAVESPYKEFKLWYCLSKSLRIPDFTIDDIGIQPDYYIDDSIPQYKWVEFVNEILNN